jgi:uncharacterized protein with von Willebrand factor type A (vWA) domain
MAGRKKKLAAPSPRRLREPASATCWIESDSYDRARFADLLRDSPSVAALEEKGRVFLPQFPSLLEDLFCALYKHNVVWLPKVNVAPSSRVNEVLLRGLLASTPYSHLRERTPLDEGRAGLAAALLGECALEILRTEKIFTRRDLLDHFELARDEAEMARRLDELANADTTQSDPAIGEATRSELERLAERLDREADIAEGRLRRKTAEISSDLERKSGEAQKRLEAEALGVAQVFDDAADEAESWGRALGGSGSASQSLELGRRLAQNRKLRKLSRLLGRMREQALALRHRLFERRNEEIYEVGSGRDLARMLPHELLALRQRELRRDWRRRYVEGQLLEYSLRGGDERGRGPMIVCLDVSSSMAGDKEIWSKAVTLTLLDIARRERRRFRAILFSSTETPLKTFDLNRGERYRSDLHGALDLADYFPGGGTDFERPLDAALECLADSRFRKGDIVLVTDGECRVGEAWRERFVDEKARLDFSLYSIAIDVGGSTLDTLTQISDRVSRVSDLTAGGVKDLFVHV